MVREEAKLSFQADSPVAVLGGVLSDGEAELIYCSLDQIGYCQVVIEKKKEHVQHHPAVYALANHTS